MLMATDRMAGAQEILESVAYAGQPWGVASVLVPVGQIEPGLCFECMSKRKVVGSSIRAS